MWVYKYATGSDNFDVGFYTNEGDQSGFYSVNSFQSEVNAARLVHYLNGGRGKAKRLLNPKIPESRE